MLGIVALFDALLVAAIPVMFANEAWFLLVGVVSVGLMVNWAYLSPRARALKWLAPGLIFLGLFVIWPVIYTVYVSFTNWSTGNSLSKGQVIEHLEGQVILSAEGGISLELSVYQGSEGELAFLARDEQGETYFGEPRARDEPAGSSTLIDVGSSVDPSGTPPETIGGYERLELRDLFAIAGELEDLVLDIPNRGVVQVVTPSQARLIEASSRYRYQPDTDTLLDIQQGALCEPSEGSFVCEDGRTLDPGWVEVVGFDNYNRILTNERIRRPFLGVFTWNVIFAGLSVFLTFAAGLVLAIALQDERLKGRAWYRSIFILPYAVPGFLSIIVWRGLLNNRFGQVNGVLESIGLDPLPWLTNGFWAKVAIVLVNLWLGFPYMFLITSGALAAVPLELKDAARVDGAGPWRTFRTITLPLLLVSTAPLLIGAFAFNFNNFVLVFLLTNGGPPLVGSEVPVGHTDLLITFTFDLALRAGRGNNFALGSAVVIVIFLVLAVISAVSFRGTRRLEEIYSNV